MDAIPKSPVTISDRNRHRLGIRPSDPTSIFPFTMPLLLPAAQTPQLCERAKAEISARVLGCETRAIGEDVDVLHGRELSGGHVSEVGEGDSRHWEGENINVRVAESVSIDGHR